MWCTVEYAQKGLRRNILTRGCGAIEVLQLDLVVPGREHLQRIVAVVNAACKYMRSHTGKSQERGSFSP